MKMTIKTVGDLIRELEKYPPYMNVFAKGGSIINNIHYNGKIQIYDIKDSKYDTFEGLIIE